jgi:hypothetical protein
MHEASEKKYRKGAPDSAVLLAVEQGVGDQIEQGLGRCDVKESIGSTGGDQFAAARDQSRSVLSQNGTCPDFPRQFSLGQP